MQVPAEFLKGQSPLPQPDSMAATQKNKLKF
jgi:hypothetical protein